MVLRIITKIFFVSLLTGCSVSKNYNPDRKYSVEELKSDYTVLRSILEKKHPSLYWYTPKDSMDYYFDKGYNSIKDSMTELLFGWRILAPLIHTIRCGHTSFAMSKGWNKFIKDRRIPSFPLYFKVWKDTMVVTGNLNKKDSLMKNGMIVTSINGIKNHDLINTMFSYLPEDGYADNVNYIRLSTNFPYYHRNIFGIYSKYRITYIDSIGSEHTATIPYYYPPKDTSAKAKKPEKAPKPKKITRKQRRENIRSFSIDSSGKFGLMKLNSFSKGHLKSFFHRTFTKMKDSSIQNLIIDLRANGGGDISNSVALTKYIRHTPFKVVDSASAATKHLSPYGHFIKEKIFNSLGLFFLTHKKKDGRYHFTYWENHSFKPKRLNYTGKVYILINGFTFSASTLFCNVVKGQENVKLIGEEAGGGWYGNSGIFIPDIVLSNTKLRVRLPLFRIVQYQHISEKGIGVMPDIYIGPTLQRVRENGDPKMDEVKRIIVSDSLIKK